MTLFRKTRNIVRADRKADNKEKRLARNPIKVFFLHREKNGKYQLNTITTNNTELQINHLDEKSNAVKNLIINPYSISGIIEIIIHHPGVEIIYTDNAYELRNYIHKRFLKSHNRTAHRLFSELDKLTIG